MLSRSRVRRPGLSSAAPLVALSIVLLTGFSALAALPPGSSQAQEATAGSSHAQDRKPLSLAFVPKDAIMVIAGRPAALLKRPDFKPAAEAAKQEGGFKETFGIPLHEIEQVLNVIRLRSTATIVRASKPIDSKTVAAEFAPGAVAKERHGRPWYQSGRRACFFPDDRTVILFPHLHFPTEEFIDAGRNGASQATWAGAWDQVATDDIALLFHVEPVRHELDEDLRRDLADPVLKALAPLWQNARTVALGATFTDRLTLHGIARCENAADAAKVKEALAESIKLAKALLGTARESVDRLPDEKNRQLALQGITVAQALLEKVETEQRGKAVHVRARVGEEFVGKLAASITPAFTQAREAARRASCKNNLKQIVLALHNYHDVNKRFPRPVVIGPDGKTPHSWRVELLPYLDAKALYDEYRMNEPWDSPHNKKLLAKMPDAFRHPSRPKDSIAAAYYVLNGPGTVFSGAEGEEGTRIGEIRDGASNTIAVVEARHDIPWTKPEDIPCDPEGDLPKLGGFHEGGFHAAMCDGAVRFISEAIDKKVLKALITKDGGELVGEF